MLAANKMVGENKGKNKKEHGLSCCINRIVTMNMGKIKQKHCNQGNLNIELKGKEERKEKETNI